MNNKIKKENLNYDQSGRAYPDNPQIKENWDYIWEKDGKHYKLVGDNEHKEWEEIENQYKVMNKEEAKDELIKVLYSQVMDLSMMSKIELGDDVIAEIKRLNEIING